MNLVLVLADDMRWDLLDVMPKTQAEIIAGQAVDFTNAFCTNPVCCAARVTTLGGGYSRSTGIYGNNPPVGGFNLIEEYHIPLAPALHDAGYTTGLFGKYLNGYNIDNVGYVAPGWDEWWAIAAGGGAYFDYTVSENGTSLTYGATPEDYLTDVIAARAEDFISTAPEPFFAFVTPISPHKNAVPAPRHAGAFAGLPNWRPPSHNEQAIADKPEWLRNKDPLTPEVVKATDDLRLNMHRTMLGCDDLVERVLTTLRNRGVLEDTLVIFTADNGYLWGEHRLEGKSVPYVEATRTPFVVWGAATGAQNALISNVDIAPTLWDYAGIAVTGSDGRSLRGTFNGLDPGPDHIILEHHEMAKIPAWVIAQRKARSYTFYATGEEEYWNLSADPLQRENKIGASVASTSIAKCRNDVRRFLDNGGPPGMGGARP